MRNRSFRSTVAVALSALTTLAAAPAPAAIAMPSRADKPSDGEPTPAACRALGFNIPEPINFQGATGQRSRHAYAAPSVAMPAPPPPPPAPPPPPMVMPPPPSRPAVVGESYATADVVVTAQRAAGSVVRPEPPGIIAPPRPQDTERYPDATPNPVKRVAAEPVSTFSIDVDTASYSNTRRFIEEGRLPPPDAVRVEEMVNYFDYGYARPASRNEPFAVTTSVMDSPWNAGRQIVHVGLQGYELPASERQPLNLTFMVDVSGSMMSPDKLDMAKKSMNLIIDQLRPEDRVAVTFYASDVGTAVAPTPGDQKLKLRCAVETLNAGGSTAGAQGMVNAYAQAEAAFGRDKVNRILMFTDGDFNVGVTENDRLEDYVARKRETGIYLSVYGFGRGNYQDERMQAIAQAGNGTAAYVDDMDEARRLFGPMFNRGAFPIADDVKIQVEFNPARVAEYRLIGYETRLLNEEDFNNDRVDAGEVGSGASVTALYEITPVGGPVQVPDRRYSANRDDARPAGDPSGELAFVQVRYKLPGQRNSRLIQHDVSGRGEASDSARWALAVAGFGQLLRNDPWMTSGYGFSDVASLAQSARGSDEYGERAEFIRLVRDADSARIRERP